MLVFRSNRVSISSSREGDPREIQCFVMARQPIDPPTSWLLGYHYELVRLDVKLI